MILLIIGLFIGSIFGFVISAMLAKGKSADEYTPLSQASSLGEAGAPKAPFLDE